MFPTQLVLADGALLHLESVLVSMSQLRAGRRSEQEDVVSLVLRITEIWASLKGIGMNSFSGTPLPHVPPASHLYILGVWY